MPTSPLCQAQLSQLLIIDVQDRLARTMDETILEQLLRNTRILIEAAIALEIPIVRTEQYPKGLGPTVAAIAEKLPAGQTAYEKTCFSSCGAAGIDTQLNDITRKQLIVTGMEAHICVLQSAIELQQQGKQVFVVQDAVCSRSKQHYKNALARLQQAGVIITNAESVLFEWLKDASHAQFKTLSRLIR
ncbi:MAG: isochorismatase family protein [Gammaproteobacteria bacterium]|nr:isochorismatase family protein [Gammaproteobacteria bacterium]